MRRPGKTTKSDLVLSIIRVTYGDRLNAKIDNAESELKQHAAFIERSTGEPQEVTDESLAAYLGLIALGEMHRETEQAKKELFA